MPDDQVPSYMKNYVKTLWQGLYAGAVQMSPEQLRTEAEKLQKGLRRRAIITCILTLFATATGVAVLMLFFSNVPINALQRIGLVLVIVGGASAFLRALRLWPARVTPDRGQTECIRFYRVALERERDSYRGWLSHCRRVILVGVLIFLVGFARASSQGIMPAWIVGVAGLILATWGVRFDWRMARVFQSRIDALEASLRSAEQ